MSLIAPFQTKSVVQQWVRPDVSQPKRARETTDHLDGNMESLLKGRLRNTHLPLSNALTPLFEGIVNSIHAVEDDAAAGGRKVRQHQITVRMERSPQKALQLDAKALPREPIQAFEIEDDGVGFTGANWKSFQVLDSLEKASRGCRGIGRLTWLKVFDRVQIDSLYSEGGTLFRRKFSFDPEQSVQLVSNEAVSPQAKRTVVRLEGFDHRFADSAPKSARPIAMAILEHCLWYFVREQGAPKILVVDREDRIDLDDLFDEHMHGRCCVTYA